MTSISDSRRAALLGLALALPFLIANFIVGNRIEPFFSWIRPGLHTSTQEYFLLFAVILLIGVGAAIAVALGSEIYRCDVLRIANCD